MSHTHKLKPGVTTPEPSVQTPADTGCGDHLWCNAQRDVESETEDLGHTANERLLV